MTISQVECFIEAAKTGSISKAAGNLFISQQNVSRQIKAVEDELGFPVFERHNRGVSLTDWGQILYEGWAEALQSFRTAADKAKDRYHHTGNRIRVGIHDFGHRLTQLADGLVRFNLAYPELDVDYAVEPVQVMMDELAAGRLDFLIVYESELEGRESMKRLQLENTLTEAGICISKNHQLAKKKKLEIRELVGEICGTYTKETSTDFSNRIHRFVERNHMENKIRFREYSSRQSLQLALITGKCFTIMYRDILDGAEDRLRFYPLRQEEEFSKIVLTWLDDKNTIKAKNMIGFLD